MISLQGHKFQEFSFQIYQKESNKFVAFILWVMVSFQFPIGFTLAYAGLFFVKPVVFFYNALFLASITVLLMVLIRINFDIKRIKYILMTLIILAAGVMVYTYMNDVALQFIWVFPLIIASLYFDELLMKVVTGASIVGLLVMSVISPIAFSPHQHTDLYLTSWFLITSLMMGVYLIFQRSIGVKNAINRMFVAVTSGTTIINHTVKNEITTLDILLDSLSRCEDPKKREELLQIAKDSTQHLMQMVDKIQTYIQDVRLELVPTNLTEVIQQCLLSFEKSYLVSGQTLKTELEEDVTAVCDPIHFREMISNFLKNAKEAICEEDGTIEVSLKRFGSEAVISIKDNGCGIPKEHLSHVVDPFFSSKKNRKVNYGLGLTYCYNIVRAHCGYMDIISENNKGTCIRVRIPLNPGKAHTTRNQGKTANLRSSASYR